MIVFRTATSRAEVYRSDEFQREVAKILQRDRRDVRLYVCTMLKAGRIAVDEPDASPEATVGREAARILAAIASRQIKDASIVRVTDRILAMIHRCDVSEGGRGTDTAVGGGSFQDDLAEALRNAWECSEGIVAGLPFPPHIAVTWNDGGSVLYGHIKDTKEGATALYSTAAIPAGDWDFVRTDAVGGSGFTPMPLLGFAECVRDAARADEDGDSA